MTVLVEEDVRVVLLVRMVVIVHAHHVMDVQALVEEIVQVAVEIIVVVLVVKGAKMFVDLVVKELVNMDHLLKLNKKIGNVN